MIRRIRAHRMGEQHNFKDPARPRYIRTDLVTQPPSATDTFRVVSYNIKLSQQIQPACTLLSQHADLKHADVICLQEMNLPCVEALAEKLNYNYIYYPAVTHPVHKMDFGNAILTRWPFQNDRKVILPHVDHRRLQRIAVGAELLIQNRPVTVFSVHKEVFLKAHHRTSQVRSIINAIPPGVRYCMIAGDFNTFTQRNLKAIIDEFRGAQFDLATGNIGWTYQHWYLLNKRTILDHIFTKGLQVVSAGKVLDRSASDHLPIWSTLTFDDKIVI